mmetsp:Transcript_31622/g.96278  ORF Transcript_31622/g.96278 Transcript_31622/m.96278 type:complete len:396 (-) Transcript_31622:103-1290(-)
MPSEERHHPAPHLAQPRGDEGEEGEHHRRSQRRVRGALCRRRPHAGGGGGVGGERPRQQPVERLPQTSAERDGPAERGDGIVHEGEASLQQQRRREPAAAAQDGGAEGGGQAGQASGVDRARGRVGKARGAVGEDEAGARRLELAQLRRAVLERRGGGGGGGGGGGDAPADDHAPAELHRGEDGVGGEVEEGGAARGAGDVAAEGEERVAPEADRHRRPEQQAESDEARREDGPRGRVAAWGRRADRGEELAELDPPEREVGELGGAGEEEDVVVRVWHRVGGEVGEGAGEEVVRDEGGLPQLGQGEVEEEVRGEVRHERSEHMLAHVRQVGVEAVRGRRRHLGAEPGAACHSEVEVPGHSAHLIAYQQRCPRAVSTSCRAPARARLHNADGGGE